LKKGDVLMTGMRLESGRSARMLFQITGGGTLRLDVNSCIYLESPSLLRLDYGALYVDSARAQKRLTLTTLMGNVRDIGTQFEVRMHQGTLVIRVREGSVSL